MTQQNKTPAQLASVWTAFLYAGLESVVTKFGDERTHKTFSGGGALESATLCAEYAARLAETPEVFQDLPDSIVCYQILEKLFPVSIQTAIMSDVPDLPKESIYTAFLDNVRGLFRMTNDLTQVAKLIDDYAAKCLSEATTRYVNDLWLQVDDLNELIYKLSGSASYAQIPPHQFYVNPPYQPQPHFGAFRGMHQAQPMNPLPLQFKVGQTYVWNNVVLTPKCDFSALAHTVLQQSHLHQQLGKLVADTQVSNWKEVARNFNGMPTQGDAYVALAYGRIVKIDPETLDPVGEPIQTGNPYSN